MTIINVHQAKASFSKLVRAVMHGEEIIIAKSGRLVARLVPITAVKAKRKPGALKGKIRVSADFDALLPKDAFLTGC